MDAPDIHRLLRDLEELSSLLNQVDEENPSTWEGIRDSLGKVLKVLEKLPGLPLECLQSLKKAEEGLFSGCPEALAEAGKALDELFIHLDTVGAAVAPGPGGVGEPSPGAGREDPEASSGKTEHAAETAHRHPGERGDAPLPEKEAEELSMDLEVLCGLAEELEPGFVPGMANILERNLAREALPGELHQALKEAWEALDRFGQGDREARNTILASLLRAREVLSTAVQAGVEAFLAGEDARPLEEELERLEELEAFLMEEEKRESPHFDRAAEYLSALAGRSEGLKLGSLAKELLQTAEALGQGKPSHRALDILLQLKDKLYEHFQALLEASGVPAEAEEIAALLASLRQAVSEGTPPSTFRDTTIPRDTTKDQGLAPRESSPTGSVTGVRPLVGLQAAEEELVDFVAEAPEDLQRVETALLELEKDPECREWLNEAFRGFHNLKGSAGFLKLEDMVNVAHAAENLLSEAREGRVKLTGPYADLALEALDLLREMLRRVQDHLQGKTYRSPDHYPEVLSRLRSWKEAAPGPGKAGETRGHRTFDKRAVPTGTAGVAPRRERVVASEESSLRDLTEEAAVATGSPTGPAGSRLERGSEEGSTAGTRAAPEAGRETAREQFVKVSTTRLDSLIDVVGELVIAHSMVAQEEELRATKNPRLAKNLSQLSKIIRELQELAMALRMVSLKPTFQKMARAARDLSVRSGVPVDFTYSGEDTEIDRNVVEEIANPLVHMIRNAIDHGIEPPEERRARGKPERGRIHLRGYHQGGNVVIELEDDGRGIDPAKVLAKARAQGLVREDEELSREEVLQLIFREGFSTADRVTDISGRGVGMDVVKRTVESLRGRVEVQSELGRGTRVTLRLPLTLAIIDGMVTRVGGENYILPSIAIQESFRPAAGQLKTVSGKGELILSRGELIPLFRLHRLFAVPGAVEDPYRALVLVIGDNGKKCGLMVDEIEGQQQVVIKPLGQSLPRLPGVAGGAIMGSGRVALILDPQELISLSGRR
jgi:two-component system chemotaxis sensor kinase CheA